MKKHFFNVIAALALVCGVFAFSGCTDYEEDINAINDRLDNLETGQLASLEEQLKNMNEAIRGANELIDILNGNVGDLQNVDKELREQIAELNGDIETVEGNIADINTKLSEQEKKLDGHIDYAVDKIADVEKELLAAIEQLNKELNDAINSGSVDVEESITRINERIDDLINQVNNLNTTSGENSADIKDLYQQIKNDKAELTKLIYEQHNINSGKINELSKKIDDNYNTLVNHIGRVDLRIDSLKSSLSAIESEFNVKIDGINGVLDEFRGEFAEVAADIEEINGRINELDEQLQYQMELLAGLTENVAAIDAAVKALQKLHGEDIADLQDAVDSIKNNYLTVDSAEVTFSQIFGDILALQDRMSSVETGLKALEDLNIAERLNQLESDYAGLSGKFDDYIENLETIVIPGLEDKINAAHNAADEAMAYAKEVNDKLTTVAGELDNLVKALGIYAKGGLEDKIGQLETMDETLKLKMLDLEKRLQEEFNGKIGDLSTYVAEEISGLQRSINELAEELRGAIDQLEKNKLDRSEFEAYMKDLGAQLEETEGQLREDMAKGLADLTQKLEQNVAEINKRIDEIDERLKTLEENFEDLKNDVDNIGNKVDDWTEANDLTISELINRIQSLVFVPEYKDGMASSYAYTVAGQAVSETQNVIATFQVKPNELAADIVAAAKEGNVTLSAVPVINRTAAGESTDISGEDIKVELGEFPGRVEIEALVPRNMQNFYIALTVCDKDKPEGSHVTSEYVEVERQNTSLDGNYALVKAEDNRTVYDYTTAHFERQWSEYPGEVAFYEGYDLKFNYGGEYVEISEAEKALFLPEGSLALEYTFSTSDPYGYLGINVARDEEKGYGAVASMKENPVNNVGDKITVYNTFYYNSSYNTVGEVSGETTYEITNVRYTLNLRLMAWGDEQRIPWTYERAVEHKILYNGTQEPLFLDEAAILNWETDYAGKDGAAENIEELLKNGTPRFEKFDRTVEGGQAEDLLRGAADLNASDIVGEGNVVIEVSSRLAAQVVDVTIDGYQFEKGRDVRYDIQKVYTDDNAHSEVVINLTYTLGEMPVDRTKANRNAIDLGNQSIPFIGSSKYFKDLGSVPFDNAYPGDEFFKDKNAFIASLADNGSAYGATDYDYTTLAWRVLDNYPYQEALGKGSNIPYDDLWTFLGILKENHPNETDEPNPAYIRISSKDIDKFGDEFNFTTTVETWYGVTYEFNATATIDNPVYSLEFDEGVVVSTGEFTGHAYLGGQIPTSGDYAGKYSFPVVRLNEYFHVENYDGQDNLRVRFEPITKENALTGYVNVPIPTEPDVKVNPDGSLDMSDLDWNGFTGRDYDFNAILYVTIDGGSKVEFTPKKVTITATDPIELLFDGEDEHMANGFDRKYGKDLEVKAWQYVDIMALVQDNINPDNRVWRNIAEVETGGEREHEYYEFDGPTGLSESYYMKAYDAVLKFCDKSEVVVEVQDGGTYTGIWDFDPVTGIFTFDGDNLMLQNNLQVTIKASINYQLDYNGVVATDKAHEGNNKNIEIKFTIKAEK